MTRELEMEEVLLLRTYEYFVKGIHWGARSESA